MEWTFSFYGKKSPHLKLSQEEPSFIRDLSLVSLQQNICMDGLHVHQLLLIIFKHMKGSRLDHISPSHVHTHFIRSESWVKPWAFFLLTHSPPGTSHSRRVTCKPVTSKFGALGLSGLLCINLFHWLSALPPSYPRRTPNSRCSKASPLYSSISNLSKWEHHSQSRLASKLPSDPRFLPLSLHPTGHRVPSTSSAQGHARDPSSSTWRPLSLPPVCTHPDWLLKLPQIHLLIHKYEHATPLAPKLTLLFVLHSLQVKVSMINMI